MDLLVGPAAGCGNNLNADWNGHDEVLMSECSTVSDPKLACALVFLIISRSSAAQGQVALSAVPGIGYVEHFGLEEVVHLFFPAQLMVYENPPYDVHIVSTSGGWEYQDCFTLVGNLWTIYELSSPIVVMAASTLSQLV